MKMKCVGWRRKSVSKTVKLFTLQAGKCSKALTWKNVDYCFCFSCCFSDGFSFLIAAQLSSSARWLYFILFIILFYCWLAGCSWPKVDCMTLFLASSLVCLCVCFVVFFFQCGLFTFISLLTIRRLWWNPPSNRTTHHLQYYRKTTWIDHLPPSLFAVQLWFLFRFSPLFFFCVALLLRHFLVENTWSAFSFRVAIDECPSNKLEKCPFR